MRVGIYDLLPSEKRILEKILAEKNLNFDLFVHSIEHEDKVKDYEVVGVFVHSSVNEKTLSKFPNLKAVITMSTGFNHIDLDYCKSRGIAVYNIPDYGTQTVAEFTLLLMLAVLRKFNVIMDDVKCSLCIDPQHLQGRELNKKVVGIVGTGRIGTKVIELLKGFDVKILAYNRSVKEDLVQQGVEFVSLEELLQRSDIISLHLPLTPETRHILNEERLKLLKKDAVIINTARGELIDTEALVKRIDVLYLGLDVVEGEKTFMNEIDVVKINPDRQELLNAFYIEFLIKHPRAIITPHIAYNTEEAEYRRLLKTVETVEEIKKGNFDLYNRVG